jgi:membrane protease subunit (stomatin/prohibitin family)
LKYKNGGYSMKVTIDSEAIATSITEKTNQVRDNIAETINNVVSAIKPEAKNFCMRCGHDVRNLEHAPKFCPGCGKKW